MNEKHNYMPDKQKIGFFLEFSFAQREQKNVKVPMYERSFDIRRRARRIFIQGS